MKLFNLKDSVRGWFVGNFEPSVLSSKDFEVGIKRYKAGDTEKSHYHKLTTEITVVVSGEVKMNGVVYKQDDIIEILPGESTDFLAVIDSITCVVRNGSYPNDKYEK